MDNIQPTGDGENAKNVNTTRRIKKNHLKGQGENKTKTMRAFTISINNALNNSERKSDIVNTNSGKIELDDGTKLQPKTTKREVKYDQHSTQNTKSTLDSKIPRTHLNLRSSHKNLTKSDIHEVDRSNGDLVNRLDDLHTIFQSIKLKSQKDIKYMDDVINQTKNKLQEFENQLHETRGDYNFKLQQFQERMTVLENDNRMLEVKLVTEIKNSEGLKKKIQEINKSNNRNVSSKDKEIEKLKTTLESHVKECSNEREKLLAICNELSKVDIKGNNKRKEENDRNLIEENIRHKALEKTLNALTKECQALRLEIENKTSEFFISLTDKDRLIEGLNKELQNHMNCNKELERLENMCTAIEVKNNENMESILHKDKIIQDLKEALHNLTNCAVTERKNLETKCLDLEKKCNDLTAQLEKRDTDMSNELTNKIQDLICTNQDLKKELIAHGNSCIVHENIILERDREITGHIMDIEVKCIQIQNLKNEMNEIERQFVKELEHHEDQIQKLKEENKTLEHQAIENNKNYENVVEENKTYLSELHEKQKYCSTLLTILQNISSNLNESVNIPSVAETLNEAASQNEIKRLKKLVQNAQNDVSFYKQKFEKTTRNCIDLQQELDTLQNLRKDLEIHVSNFMNSETSKVHEIKSRNLHEIKCRKSDCEQKIKTLEKNFTVRLKEKEEERQKLYKKYEDEKQKCNELEDRNRELDNIVRDCKETKRKMQEQISQLRNENQQLLDLSNITLENFTL